MPLDGNKETFIFDDRTEFSKVRGWYDRLREESAKETGEATAPPVSNETPGDKRRAS